MSTYQDAVNSAVESGMPEHIAVKIVNKLHGFNVAELFCHQYSRNYGNSTWYTVLKHASSAGIKSFDTFCDPNGRIVRRKVVEKSKGQ